MRQAIQTATFSVLAASLTMMAGQGALGAFVTTGVYDEQTVQTNAVDAVASPATGSAARVIESGTEYTQFKTDVATAWANNKGGVVGFDSFTPTDSLGTGGSIAANYGTGATKTLNISTNSTSGLSLITNLTNRLPISAKGESGRTSTQQGGTNGTALTMNSLTGFSGTATVEFIMGGITNGAANEVVGTFGVTVLSRTSRDLGTVTGVATFSDSSTATATYAIGASAAGAKDVFYGFVAPAGLSISKVSISYPITGENSTSFDDVAFITVPEPASMGALGIGAMGLLAGRRRVR